MRVVAACASTWSLWRVCLADCDCTHVEKETASWSSLCAPSNSGAHLNVRTKLWLHIWLLSLQAISTQPTQSFPQVCLPKPYLQQPAPSYTGGCGSQFGEQSGNTDNLCRSLSFIFSKWLLRNPLYLKLPLHPGWSPCWWGSFPHVITWLNLHLPVGYRFHPASISSSFLFFLLSYQVR